MALGTPTDIGVDGNANANTNQQVVTLTAAVSSGDKIEVIGFRTQNAVTISSVTDSQGNTYTLGPRSNGNLASIEMWWADCSTALSVGDTITVTWNDTANTRHVVFCRKVSGAATGAPPQTTTGGTSSFASTWTMAASMTTTDANALVRGAAIGEKSGLTDSTAGTDYTELGDVNAASAADYTDVYRQTTATGAYTPNGSWNTTASSNTVGWTWNPAAAAATKPKSLLSLGVG